MALDSLLARRRAALALAVSLALLAGGWLWLRDSSLVAVEHVRVTGVAGHGTEAGAIEAALVRSAHGMSTLDVKLASLRAAVAGFPVVSSVKARASFPHGLSVEVVEQPPVAALEAGGARTAVAADGVALGPRLLSGSLPVVHESSSALAVLPLAGHRVRGDALLAQLNVLGAVPRPLAGLVTRAYIGPHGVTVALANRMLAFFGDASRPHAKWLSLARVLADPSSNGAAYVDVRVPERPAAGFAPGTARPGLGTEGEPSSASDPTTAAALAAGLEAAVSGGANPAVSATSASGAGGAGEAASSTGGEAGSAREAPSAPASGGESSSQTPTPGG